MVIPRVGFDGVRQTVNANLTPAQMTWNLRSALNVAALNCLDPQHAAILPNYKALLDNHASALSAANRALASEFRQKYGATYRDVQDSYMTQVYNYFALPPAQDAFCDVALSVSTELLAVEKGNLDSFSAIALPRIEGVFENFFRAYEQYRVDLAAWDSRYGPPVVTTTATGYVNPLDPAVNIPAGTTTVGTMPATQPIAGAQPVVSVPVAPSTATGTVVNTGVQQSAASSAGQAPVSGPIVRTVDPTAPQPETGAAYGPTAGPDPQ
ncbi:hypothetical protein GRI48_04990 [Altererythrobacter oceanensis]|uniref:Uncharacterized protein n=2 Tax=Qipengyuania oceanensis TaxID=1463597 RepID=A0A844YH82_9SPHN|nr:hypothetical protein [Qipengyuania oceanensis]